MSIRFTSKEHSHSQHIQPSLSKSMLKASLLASAIILPAFSEVVSAEEAAELPIEISENNIEEIKIDNRQEVEEKNNPQELTEEDQIVQQQLIIEAEQLIPDEILADIELEELTLEELDKLISDYLTVNEEELVNESEEIKSEEDALTQVGTQETVEEIEIDEAEEVTEEATEEALIDEQNITEQEVNQDSSENFNDDELETQDDELTEAPFEAEKVEKTENLTEEKEDAADLDSFEAEKDSEDDSDILEEEPALENLETVVPTEASEETQESEVENITTDIEADQPEEAAEAELEAENDLEEETFTISETVTIDNQPMVVAQTFSLAQEEPIQIATYSQYTPSDVTYFDIKTDNAFLNKIAPHAVEVAGEYKLYPSVMMAQAALESGYGGSGLSSAPNHNLFGIKGKYNGDSVTMNTSEYTNNGWIYLPQEFRKYPSYSESLEDNARLLRNGLTWNTGFYSGTWVENTNSYRDATQWLQGRYATDPSYASKLNNIITSFGLDRYDNALYNSGVPSPEFVWEDLEKDKPVTDRTVHTVVYGDTLSGIASGYNTTVAKIKANNNLKSDLIFVGQKLTVGETKSQSKPSQPAPTPTPTPSENQDSNRATHTVVYGDTLSGIASRYNTTVAKIKTNNNLKSDLIFVGQKLTVGETKSQSKPSQPAPTPTPSENQDSNRATHTVVYGDTLSGIASRYNTTVAKIKADNNLKSDLIVVGQKLTVGETKSQSKPSQPAPTPSENKDSNGATHTVVYGDTLSGIASRYNTTVAKIKADNNLKSDLIVVGQKLTVGETKSQSKPSQPAPTPSENKDSNSATHTVVYGDTLSGIASRYNTTVAKIKTNNNLKSDLIFVGQKLKLNGTHSESGSQKPQHNSPKATAYTVVYGDTLSGIARRYNTTVSKLKRNNGLNSDLILVGQKLKI